MAITRTFDDFRRTLSAASIDVGSLSLRDDGTIAPASEADTRPEPEPSAGLLTLSSSDAASELRLGEVIGTGGLGVVREATQASLQRPVAVKTLREDARTPFREREFIREARVTGMLEHPNIVPVHALGRAEDGRPLMVMKRVTGRPWSELIAETFGRVDHLETHLEILNATCRAVELAHSRGVIHRDLKPDNVLVGDFGEVTVVDWGLAAAVGEAPIEGMPQVRELRRVVGTPRYMAPEMASGNGPAMGLHTDVYLLGAILHEILTGDTRHTGDTLMAMLYHAFASKPVAYGSDVPRELAAIANRATRAEPSERFETVAAFREALARYRRNESSRALTAAAIARLERLAPDEDEGGRTTLTECRFAFQQALSLWPDNAEASEGLKRTLMHMVESALERGELTTAEGLLTELGEVPGSLEERLATLRSRVEARAARMKALEERAREHDLGMAAQRRRRYGIAFGLLFPLVNVALGALHLAGVARLSHLAYVVASGLCAVLVLLPALPRLSSMAPNRASRRLLAALAIMLFMQAPIFLLTGAYGLDLLTSLSLSLYQLGGTVMVGSFMVRPRMVWAGFVVVLLGVVASIVPALAYFCVAAAYAVFVLRGSTLPWEETLEPDP